MIFFGQPNLKVIIKPKRWNDKKGIYKFDEEGKCEVTNDRHIQRMKHKFEYKEKELSRKELFKIAKEKGLANFATLSNEKLKQLIGGKNEN